MTQILDRAGDLLSAHDVAFCDVWGVVHDGVKAYPEANEALARFRAGGGTVILVSNVPTTSDYVERLLARFGVRRDAWDGLVTSGDLTRWRLREGGEKAVHHIGTDGDRQIFDGLGVSLVGLDAAQIVVATELVDDRRETAEDYLPVLRAARARGLPFICGNPDLAVYVGAELRPCAGALALLYADLGGEVFWCGKPHAPAFERALALATAARGAEPAKDRILAIGDSLRTDIAGGRDFGIKGLLVAGGLHRDKLLGADGAIHQPGLALACAFSGVEPHAVVPRLRW